LTRRLGIFGRVFFQRWKASVDISVPHSPFSNARIFFSHDSGSRYCGPLCLVLVTDEEEDEEEDEDDEEEDDEDDEDDEEEDDEEEDDEDDDEEEEDDDEGER
jgi:hypothetical protein